MKGWQRPCSYFIPGKGNGSRNRSALIQWHGLEHTPSVGILGL